MPDTFTNNLNLDQPAIDGDIDTWGTIINNDLNAIDGVFNGDGSGTSVGLNIGAGKTLNIAGTLKSVAGAFVKFLASTFSLLDDTDQTKVLKFDLSGISAGQTRTLTVPDASGTIATTASVQSSVTARLPTGTKLEGYYGGVAPAGFVLACGRTLGPAGSGATERANNDTQALYNSMWAQGFVPAGGAGVSAAADWAALKPIPLPDYRSAGSIGKDNLGGVARNLIATATDPTTLVGTPSVTPTGTAHIPQIALTASGGGTTNNSNGFPVQTYSGSGNNDGNQAGQHTHNFGVTVTGNTNAAFDATLTVGAVSTVQPSNVVDVIIAL